jgi:5-hydroxyisourate hydrolase
MACVLTTHVLDVANGRPAAGVAVELWRDGERVSAQTTNADGRCDAPLVAEGALQEGEYELRFAVGAYFGEAAFLDVVPVRFTVGDAAQKYHVPLLVSPWSYSTYRGS